MTHDNYLIWSNEHRAWWKGSRHGYTTRTDLAGRFTFAEASKICDDANRHTRMGQNEIMVPAPSRHQCQLDLYFPDR